MNFSAKEDSLHDFQMAPLIDIVFLLLVFFIATYSMTQIERELSVNLPDATSAAEPTSRINELVINIDKKGEIIVNRQKMHPKQLYLKLRKLADFGDSPTVIIRADESSLHKYVVKVIDICSKAKIKQILLGTRSVEVKNAWTP